jgi:hypothetical protein
VARLKRPPPRPAPSLDASPEARADPRWRLTADSRLTPVVEYLLLAGEPPRGRVHGWAAWAALSEADIEAVWTRHRADLTAEARAYGFAAAGYRGPKPSGPAFERWRERFLARHTY